MNAAAGGRALAACQVDQVQSAAVAVAAATVAGIRVLPPGG